MRFQPRGTHQSPTRPHFSINAPARSRHRARNSILPGNDELPKFVLVI